MKTLRLLKRYTTLLEQDQPLDQATEIDPTETGADETEGQDTAPLTSEGEKYLIDLLVKAFAHTPDDNELKIVDNISQQYRDKNPKEISDAIQRLLDGGNEEFISTLGKM